MARPLPCAMAARGHVHRAGRRAGSRSSTAHADKCPPLPQRPPQHISTRHLACQQKLSHRRYLPWPIVGWQRWRIRSADERPARPATKAPAAIRLKCSAWPAGLCSAAQRSTSLPFCSWICLPWKSHYPRHNALCYARLVPESTAACKMGHSPKADCGNLTVLASGVLTRRFAQFLSSRYTGH